MDMLTVALKWSVSTAVTGHTWQSPLWVCREAAGPPRPLTQRARGRGTLRGGVWTQAENTLLCC